MKSIKKLVSIICLLAMSMFAHAASMDFEDHGYYITDKISGLDWGKLPYTYGYDIYDSTIELNYLNGDPKTNFYPASGQQINQLLADYLGTPINAIDGVYHAPIEGLLNMLGANPIVDAFTTDMFPDGAPLTDVRWTATLTSTYSLIHDDGLGGEAWNSAGTFTVRISPQIIPVPSAIVLFGLSLISLTFWKKLSLNCKV